MILASYWSYLDNASLSFALVRLDVKWLSLRALVHHDDISLAQFIRPFFLADDVLRYFKGVDF